MAMNKNNLRYQTIGTENKRQYVHRVIMEIHLGRKLSNSEVIHHKNGDKRDNRIENLEIISRSEHCRLHKKGVRFSKIHRSRIASSVFKNHYSKTEAGKKDFREKVKNGLRKKFPNGRVAWNKGKILGKNFYKNKK